MKFNPEMANKAGATGNQTGAHKGKLSAKYQVASTGTKGLELTLHQSPDQKIQFLNIWYEKADGTAIKGGMSQIMAIMGLLGLQELALDNLQHDAPVRELHGAPIGLVLQKVLYTKNNNEDGFKFEVRLPFDPQTKKTYKEKAANTEAKQVDEMLANLEDRDDRKKTDKPQQAGWQNSTQPPQYDDVPTDFDDDIPF